MPIQWSEKEFADYQAQLRRMRGESDDVRSADTGGAGVVGADADPVRRARRSSRAPAAGGVLAQAPVRHEHVHVTAAVDPRTPVLVGRWLRLGLTVASLTVWGLQIAQQADVPGPVLLVALVWLALAWLTRRRQAGRSGGFLWGVLLGASVEATLQNGRQWRGMSGGL